MQPEVTSEASETVFLRQGTGKLPYPLLLPAENVPTTLEAEPLSSWGWLSRMTQVTGSLGAPQTPGQPRMVSCTVPPCTSEVLCSAQMNTSLTHKPCSTTASPHWPILYTEILGKALFEKNVNCPKIKITKHYNSKWSLSEKGFQGCSCWLEGGQHGTLLPHPQWLSPPLALTVSSEPASLPCPKPIPVCDHSPFFMMFIFFLGTQKVSVHKDINCHEIPL